MFTSIKDDVDVEPIINNIVLEMFFHFVSRKTPNYTDVVINNIMSQNNHNVRQKGNVKTTVQKNAVVPSCEV